MAPEDCSLRRLPQVEGPILPTNRFRTGFVATEREGAELKLGRPKQGRWTLHYRPSRQALAVADPGSLATRRITSLLLVEADTKTDIVVSDTFFGTVLDDQLIKADRVASRLGMAQAITSARTDNSGRIRSVKARRCCVGERFCIATEVCGTTRPQPSTRQVQERKRI